MASETAGLSWGAYLARGVDANVNVAPEVCMFELPTDTCTKQCVDDINRCGMCTEQLHTTCLTWPWCDTWLWSDICAVCCGTGTSGQPRWMPCNMTPQAASLASWSVTSASRGRLVPWRVPTANHSASHPGVLCQLRHGGSRESSGCCTTNRSLLHPCGVVLGGLGGLG